MSFSDEEFRVLVIPGHTKEKLEQERSTRRRHETSPVRYVNYL